jgi:hypothetical protein
MAVEILQKLTGQDGKSAVSHTPAVPASVQVPQTTAQAPGPTEAGAALRLLLGRKE